MSANEEYTSSPQPVGTAIVVLQVGERRFTTTAETLTEQSEYFASLLSGRWDNTQKDGSYFIDADPSLFEHILTYLRRGIFPIFYDAIKGHDLTLCTNLLQEAKYFQIPKLVEWLEKRTYLKAIKIYHTADIYEGEPQLAAIRPSGMNVQMVFYPTWTTDRVYICPRGIPRHRGNPGACGRQCQNAQGDSEPEYEDEVVLKTLVVQRQTELDEKLVRGTD